ncbi:MAG: hypothetical protein M3O30_03755 [Planctomycetota bacterium]|nr:hypothetical protein [Planctomycetota bacterium]
MDRKLIAIVMLTLSALSLMVADFATPKARADEAVNSRDYQVVSARIQEGGEGLYILDNRTGQIAIFTYDVKSRTLRPRVIRPLSEVFR